MAVDEKSFLEDSHEPDCRSIYVAKERNSRYELKNPAKLKVLQTKVDGGLYGDGDGKKCDYSFSSKNTLLRYSLS